MGRDRKLDVETLCVQCQALFAHNRYTPRIFCSRACFYASGRGGRKRVEPTAATCVTCGVEFARKSWEVRGGQRVKAPGDRKRVQSVMTGDYCSRECYHKPRLTPGQTIERRRAGSARWRRENREHVQAYKREAYRRRRTETVNVETREMVAVLRRDPCVYCGDTADTIDHIHPVSLGGGLQWDNLAPACRACNSGKKDRPLLQYLLMKRPT